MTAFARSTENSLLARVRRLIISVVALAAVAGLASVSATAGAAEPVLSTGSWNANAKSGLTIIAPDKGDSSFYLGVGAEHFFRDALSAGGVVDIASSGGSSAFDIGPSGSLYFFSRDRLAISGKGAFLISNVSPRGGTSYTYFQLRPGAAAEYFVTQNVSFGPEMQLRFLFGSDRLTRNFEFALLGRFSLFF